MGLFEKIYPEAIIWANQFQNIQSAWEQCQRGDWMMCWAVEFAGEIASKNHRSITLAACALAQEEIKTVEDKNVKEYLKRSVQKVTYWALGGYLSFDEWNRLSVFDLLAIANRNRGNWRYEEWVHAAGIANGAVASYIEPNFAVGSTVVIEGRERTAEWQRQAKTIRMSGLSAKALLKQARKK